MGLLDFLYEDPSKKAMPYLEQIPGQTKPYFDPFINRGNTAGNNLESKYGNLLNDPSGFLNNLGKGYQQSPGFDFALKQALQGANHAAAAGGMAGSPAHQQENMGVATGLANQDYNQWLEHAIGLFGKGLSGEQNFYNKGFDASKSMADMIAQMLAGESGEQFAGTQGSNQFIGDMIKNLISGGSAMYGAFGK